MVLGTLPSQSGGPGFHLWSGKWIPPASAKTQNSQINKNLKKKKKCEHQDKSRIPQG